MVEFCEVGVGVATKLLEIWDGAAEPQGAVPRMHLEAPYRCLHHTQVDMLPNLPLFVHCVMGCHLLGPRTFRCQSSFGLPWWLPTCLQALFSSAGRSRGESHATCMTHTVSDLFRFDRTDLNWRPNISNDRTSQLPDFYRSGSFRPVPDFEPIRLELVITLLDSLVGPQFQ